MKTYHKMLLTILLAIAGLIPTATSYAGIHIEVGDRGFFNRGNFYVEGGNRYVWVPGHWGPRHRWIHGHYRRAY